MSTPAGPLTLEDLERLEARARGEDPDYDEDTRSDRLMLALARDVLRLTAALRSVMAERDTLSARVRQLQDEALDVVECRRLANVAVDQAEAARSKLRSVTDERDGLRALCDRVREAWDAGCCPDCHRRMESAIEALGPLAAIREERAARLDAALALLSKAREAFDKLRAARHDAFGREKWADLAKILGTGETT